MIPRATFIDKTLSGIKSMKTSSWLNYARPAFASATDAAWRMARTIGGLLNPK
jgi:hypothetical protein